MKTKRTKTTGNRESSQTVLARTSKRLGRCPLEAPGIRWSWTETWSKLPLDAEKLFLCTYVPKIPHRRGVNCVSQTSGYAYHKAQAFFAQYTVKTSAIAVVTFLPRHG